jgi:hypothetical protein
VIGGHDIRKHRSEVKVGEITKKDSCSIRIESRMSEESYSSSIGLIMDGAVATNFGCAGLVEFWRRLCQTGFELSPCNVNLCSP